MLMIYRKTEPLLVEGDNELPTVKFHGTELAQELILESDVLRFFSGGEAVGNQRRCFTTKPSDCVEGRWTVVVGMQVTQASSRIEENVYCSRASRIA
jgi:hypothetical protein